MPTLRNEKYCTKTKGRNQKAMSRLEKCGHGLGAQWAQNGHGSILLVSATSVNK
jgi:hypothetical protein